VPLNRWGASTKKSAAKYSRPIDGENRGDLQSLTWISGIPHTDPRTPIAFSKELAVPAELCSGASFPHFPTMRNRPFPKPDQGGHDASLLFSKKTQLGASGAVVGAIIGGPLGAVVGGIVGTAFGAAAELSPATNGVSSENAVSPPSEKRARTTSTGPKRRKSSARVRAKTTQSKRTRPRRPR
jgi:hypothetical protein